MEVSEAASEKIDRRGFYLTAIYGMWAVIGAVLAAPALVYLLAPPKRREDPQWTEVGNISRLRPREPVEMVFRRNRLDGWRLHSEKSTAWVVKLENEVVAYGPQCTHLGCAYHWNARNGEFLCPCHTSTFALDGGVTAGPAPRPLDRYEVKLEGNKLLVGRLRQQTETAS